MVPAKKRDPFTSWRDGEWGLDTSLPMARVGIEPTTMSLEEFIEKLDVDSLCHVAHEEADCQGIAFTTGLRQILQGEDSPWQLSMAQPWLSALDQRLMGLRLLMMQPFGTAPNGQLIHDHCEVLLDNKTPPCKIQLHLPHYCLVHDYRRVAYLKVDLEIDAQTGIVVCGHEDQRPE